MSRNVGAYTLSSGLNLRPRGQVVLSASVLGAPVLGEFVLDADQASLTEGGHAVPLTGRPLDLLTLLAANPGRLLSKETVLDALWGHREVGESVLKTAVSTLRLALRDNARQPHYVQTVARRGYRFIGAVHAVQLPHPGPAASAAPTRASPAASAERRPASPGNLPSLADDLVGRSAALTQLQDLMSSHRLVTVTGLGGVGKTRLALAAALGSNPPPDGTWLLRLDDLEQPGLLAPTVAGLLQLGGAAGTGVAALVRSMATLNLRLLLDNAEHLVDAVAELAAAVLAGAPRVQLLVTSQLPLRLGAERVLTLPPLALPATGADGGASIETKPEPSPEPFPAPSSAPCPVPTPDSYAAAHLLCLRIAQQRPGWQPRTEDHAEIAAICRALDGVPLALEMAAARVPLLGLAGVRERLVDRFALLTRGTLGAATRHRTLQAALDWTFSLLQPHELEALQRLAVFNGGFRFDDAEGVLQGCFSNLPQTSPAAAPQTTALDVVDELLKRSLLVADDDDGVAQPRLRLFNSVRIQALAVLRASDYEADARQRHLARMGSRFANLHRTDLFRPMLQWLPPLRADVDNLRIALHHGLAAGAPVARCEQGLWLLAHSMMVWLRSGARAEAARWLQVARQRQADHGQALDEALHWWLDFATGQLAVWGQQQAPAEARAAVQRALAGSAQHGDACSHYILVYLDFHTALRQGMAPDSGHARRAAAALQPEWPPFSQRHLISIEGLLAWMLGDQDCYRASGERLVHLCLQAGAPYEAAVGQAMVGQSLMLQGRLDPACAAYASAVASLRALGLLQEQVPTVAMSAALHLRRSLRAQSRAQALEALRLLAADGLVWWLADALPWAAWHDGRPADALRLMHWADRLAAGRQEKRGPIFAGMRADLLAVLGLPGVGGDAVLPPISGVPARDAVAVDVALGPGSWATVVPAAG